MNRYLLLLQAILILAFVGTAQAQIPRTLSYQGVLCDTLANPKADGMYAVTFRLFDGELGGTPLWAENKMIEVKRGLFHAVLGDLVPLSSLTFNRPYWLELQVGSDPVLTPRIPLTAVGYSLNSIQADTAALALSLPGNTVVKSLNGLKDHVTLAATGGATVSSHNDTIYVNASTGGTGVSGSGSAGQLTFWNSTSSIGGDNTLTWDNAAKRLGIGTAIPGTRLHVASPASNYGMLLLENSNTGDNEASIGFKKGSDATGPDIWVAGTGSWGTFNNFVIGRGGARLVMTPDGSVGMGTTTPSAETKLHIRSLTDNFGVLVDAEGTSGSEIGLHSATSKYSSLVKNAYWSSGAWRRFDVSSGASLQEFWPGGDIVLRSAGAGANPISWVDGICIRTSGNVGVGTADPVSRLHVRGTTPTYVTIEAPSGYAPGITFRVGGTNQWSLFYHPVYGYLSFFREGVGDKMIIRDNGDVVSSGTVECAILKLTGGGDIAEPFDVTGSSEVKPGSVVVIDPENPGELRISSSAYDYRVAGIVSGAGGIKPGVLMGQEHTPADGKSPVAMTGRVYCRAVATGGSIKPGDLLTTSEVPGCAMRASDYSKAQGAILGKAMSSLESGEGLVLVLVSLQ